MGILFAELSLADTMTVHMSSSALRQEELQEFQPHEKWKSAHGFGLLSPECYSHFSKILFPHSVMFMTYMHL